MNKKGFKPKTKTSQIGVRVSSDTDEFLSDLSFKSECTKSDVIRSMIEYCKTLAARGALDMDGK